MCCVSQVQSMLGCITPWLSDNSSLWCNKTFENITCSEKEDIQFLLSNILDGFADDGECFFPVANWNLIQVMNPIILEKTILFYYL